MKKWVANCSSFAAPRAPIELKSGSNWGSVIFNGKNLTTVMANLSFCLQGVRLLSANMDLSESHILPFRQQKLVVSEASLSLGWDIILFV